MKIVSFVEGAEPPGFVGVPRILASTAAQGHSIVLLMPGIPMLGADEYIVPDARSARGRKEGNGTFGIVRLSGWTRYRFCPSMLWRFNRLVREADLVTLHSLYSFPVLAGYILARLHRKPYAFWPHGVLAPYQRTVSAGRKWIYDRAFGNQILRNASVIIYSAEGERQETEVLGLRSPSVIAPEGFDANEFAVLPQRGAFRAEYFKGHSGPLVLFLARVNARKGLDIVIKAMQRVIAERPDVRLAIVGPSDPPSYGTKIDEWIRESGIEAQTVLTGLAGRELRLKIFADSDIYVLASHAENFGFSMFEAMASGLPVVVSETLNYAPAILEGGAGFAVPRSPDKFANAILELLGDPKLGRRMGACGKVLARKYSWEEAGAKTARALESVVRKEPFPAEVGPVMPSEATFR